MLHFPDRRRPETDGCSNQGSLAHMSTEQKAPMSNENANNPFDHPPTSASASASASASFPSTSFHRQDPRSCQHYATARGGTGQQHNTRVARYHMHSYSNTRWQNSRQPAHSQPSFAQNHPDDLENRAQGNQSAPTGEPSVQDYPQREGERGTRGSRSYFRGVQHRLLPARARVFNTMPGIKTCHPAGQPYSVRARASAQLRGNNSVSSSNSRRRHGQSSIDARLRALPVPLPAERPLLGPPHPDFGVLSDETIIACYQDDTEFNERANEFIDPSHPLHDVFEWWYKRVLDRLGRKMDNNRPFDRQEIILDKLHQIYQEREKAKGAKEALPDVPNFEKFSGVINFFADHIVPEGGFAVNQIKDARKDPKRWERRDRREQLWAEDETGELERAWKEQHCNQSWQMWKSIEEERWKLEKRKARGIINARFDVEHRVGKGGRPGNRRYNKPPGKRSGSGWAREPLPVFSLEATPFRTEAVGGLRNLPQLVLSSKRTSKLTLLSCRNLGRIFLGVGFTRPY